MRKGLLIVTLCAILFSSQFAWSEDARITDVVVKNTPDGIIVHFRVEGCFTDDLEQAILNGIPTTFRFLTALERVRGWWADKELASLEITHTVKYNNLKNEFVITRSEREGCPLVVNSLSEAKEIMAEVENLKIAELDILEKGHRYEVEIKAKLSKITLPFYLHYVFRFFLFLWDFETDWYTLDFMY
ncbi:MAG: DUF4390 domain-containing protein [Thermodesulfobacteriota bacterium]|nr:DUF4390 domain-containing protein [Thermodesulfobacteriota bacterium]